MHCSVAYYACIKMTIMRTQDRCEIGLLQVGICGVLAGASSSFVRTLFKRGRPGLRPMAQMAALLRLRLI